MLEIFSGFFIGVLTILAINAIIKRHNKNISAKQAKIRQSSLFLFVKRFAPESLLDAGFNKSQASVYEQSKMFNFLEMPDNKVYWMDRKRIYYADLDHGRFDPGQGKLLQMRNIPEKEVNKILYIINSLRDE